MTSTLERARQLAVSDPASALALLLQEPLPAPAEFAKHLSRNLRSMLEKSDVRVALYQRCGRDAEAMAERAAAAPLREYLLEDFDKSLATAGKPPHPLDIEHRAILLEGLGRRTEAARCRLLAADLMLAGGGNAAARARLAGGTWGGVRAGTPMSVLGSAPGFGAPGEVAKAFAGISGADKEAFATAFRVGSGIESQAKALQGWLVHEGRAIGVGLCESCGGIVETKVDPSGLGGVCAAGHHLAEAQFVVMEDAPPGFYSDPYGRFTQRQWDGRAWTSQVRRDGTPAEEPPGDPIPTQHEQMVAFSLEHNADLNTLKGARMWLRAQEEWGAKEAAIRERWRKRAHDVSKQEKRERKGWLRRSHG
jgi:hypothetical protein